ncbi:hypothetical protein [Alteribacillus bidgolensis]|uniref:Uncharacterized protein n=1 Tax=Alteribacillus bidgolensis TaxID=930129 RepID=A0A1G8RUE0_9BACI|nr:hypothetical protein [Alteribacillus bidgolensis]SDJ20559.1 hypothetical protein SAMN05216352_13310 [Alteribacillus bidgolensis]
MGIFTYLLIGILLLLMIPCFRGMNKSGTRESPCNMVGRGSCHGKRETGNPSSKQIDLEKIHAQMDELEKDNQKLRTEMRSLEKKQRL